MSQKLVYLLLKELGGTASVKQIRELAKKRYPESTLYTYVRDRIERLMKWGYIRRNSDGSYTIVAEYPY